MYRTIEEGALVTEQCSLVWYDTTCLTGVLPCHNSTAKQPSNPPIRVWPATWNPLHALLRDADMFRVRVMPSGLILLTPVFIGFRVGRYNSPYSCTKRWSRTGHGDKREYHGLLHKLLSPSAGEAVRLQWIMVLHAYELKLCSTRGYTCLLIQPLAIFIPSFSVFPHD